MPYTINEPTEPVGVLGNALYTVEYSQDFAPQFAFLAFTVNYNAVAEGDNVVINGTPWVYQTAINSPTDWIDAPSFVRQFNANPEYNTAYEATLANNDANTGLIEIKAKEATSQLNIDFVVNVTDPLGIIENANFTGQSAYAKNDIQNFAQLARIKGSTNNNQQVNSGALYYFELADQLRGQLNEFYLPSASGQLFLNEGMAKAVPVEFGTRFTEDGSTYLQRVYTDEVVTECFRGKSAGAGLLTNRQGAKVTNLGLYEACSFLLHQYTDVTSLRRKVTITYTDQSTDVVLDGSLQNPKFGIVTALAGAYTFTTDGLKTVSKWQIDLARPDGVVIHEGQTYLNLIGECTNTVQVVFTNLFGGIDTFTFKDQEERQFTTTDVVAREAELPNTFTEFNITTDETDTQILNEQSVRFEDYLVLQGLVKSKYLFIAKGVELQQVRRTSYNLTTDNFSCNFKALDNA